MEGLIAYVGYIVVSIATLCLVLVAIRLLPFISTIAATLALLQWVLPGMALIEKEGPKNSLMFLIFFVAAISSMIFDSLFIVKRLSHFWDIPKY